MTWRLCLAFRDFWVVEQRWFVQFVTRGSLNSTSSSLHCLSFCSFLWSVCMSFCWADGGGKLRAATWCIENNADSFPLSLGDSVTVSEVLDILLEKHPLHLPKLSALISPTVFLPPFHHVWHSDLSHYSAHDGPSGLDTHSWKSCVLPYGRPLINFVMQSLLLLGGWL